MLDFLVAPAAIRALHHLVNIYEIAFSRVVKREDVKLLKKSVAG